MESSFDLSEAIMLYNSGLSVRKVASIVGISPTQLGRHFSSIDFKLRPPVTHKRYTVNEEAFNVLTADTAYWLGFLLADGCITQPTNCSPRLSLKLASVDEGHLLKFKQFLSAEQPILREVTSTGRSASYITIVSAALCSSLVQYNIVPRKTFIAKPPEALMLNRDFWRGYIDGDGSLGVYRLGPKISIVGTRETCESFLLFVREVGITTNVSISPAKNVCVLSLSCYKAKELAPVLYDNATTYLTRKYETANRIKHWTGKHGKGHKQIEVIK